MPYTAAGVEHANSGGVSSLTDQIGNMNLKPQPSSSRTGWNMPPSGDNKKTVRGGKSKRNNSRKKIRKNRRTNKTRRSKK